MLGLHMWVFGWGIKLKGPRIMSLGPVGAAHETRCVRYKISMKALAFMETGISRVRKQRSE